MMGGLGTGFDGTDGSSSGTVSTHLGMFGIAFAWLWLGVNSLIF